MSIEAGQTYEAFAGAFAYQIDRVMDGDRVDYTAKDRRRGTTHHCLATIATSLNA